MSAAKPRAWARPHSAATVPKATDRKRAPTAPARSRARRVSGHPRWASTKERGRSSTRRDSTICQYFRLRMVLAISR
jgi:hypothetical protein